jgi:hypothetical protein
MNTHLTEEKHGWFSSAGMLQLNNPQTVLFLAITYL